MPLKIKNKGGETMETRSFCDMTFNTSFDKTRLIRIPQPCTSVDEDIIDHVATLFISSDPFDQTIGQLMSLRRAEIVNVQRTVLI